MRHPILCAALLDAAGVPNRFLHGTDPRKNGSEVILTWVTTYLFPVESQSPK